MPSKALCIMKFPGGKSKLVPQIRAKIDPLIEKTGIYNEVFIGGGPVLLDIANDARFNNVKLYANDKDENVFSFWKLLSDGSENDFNQLLNLLNRKPTIEMFWQEREKSKQERTLITKAFHCVFFHKTTFNGMYNASPIGGKEQKSKWTVGCHYTPKNLIKKVSEARKRIYGRLTISCLDVIMYLESSKGALYLDPPYYVAGKSLYPVFMTEEDHKKMADVLRRKEDWVLSYDDCDEIKSMYSWANINDFSAWYSSSSFSKSGKCATKKELLITR